MEPPLISLVETLDRARMAGRAAWIWLAVALIVIGRAIVSYTRLEILLAVLAIGLVLGIAAWVLWLRVPRDARGDLWWVPIGGSLVVALPLALVLGMLWLVAHIMGGAL